MILVTPLPILVTPLPKSFGNERARPPKSLNEIEERSNNNRPRSVK